MEYANLIQKLNLSKYSISCIQEPSNWEYDLSILKDYKNIEIHYKNTNHLMRSFGIIKTNINKNIFIHQKSCFENIGYMIDVARNAVPKISTIKKQILNLALLGYNRLYLYLEDLFEVPEEPYFGYLRGRYSKAEIKELDSYCSEFGIELVPAIQTLAHLNGIFQWPKYAGCNDVNDILLVGSEQTNALIKNCFKTISECFSSKTVHIGMDEAHLVGKGRYFDINGYEKTFEVIYKQLTVVQKNAEEFGFKLQMWSDMFFRISFDGAYYSSDKTLKPEIINKVPKEIAQFYWDYSTTDPDVLNNMFRNHELISNNVLFAAGAWKWNGVNPSNKFTIENLKVQLPICKKYKVKTVLLTGWSDDGAEASLFSTLPSIIYFAECCYNSDVSINNLTNISNRLFDFDFKEFLDTDLTLVTKDEEIENYTYLNYSMLPKILLYNDPLSGVYDGVIYNRFSFKNLPSLADKISSYAKQKNSFKSYFQVIGNLVNVLKLKATLGIDIRTSYQSLNFASLKYITNIRIPNLIKSLDKFLKSFTNQWLSENKTNGLGVNITRIGGLKQRLIFTQSIINDYLDGKIKKIEELEEPLLPMDDNEALPYLLWTNWNKIFTGNVR